MNKCLFGLIGMVCSIFSALQGGISDLNVATNLLNNSYNFHNPIFNSLINNNLKFQYQIGADTIEGEVMDEVDVHQLVSLGSHVSLRKSGLNVTLVTRSMIQNMPVQNLNELLSHIAGVDIRQRGVGGVQSDIGIRGSSFDQVLILVDGVRMSDPQTGHHQMNLPCSLPTSPK